MIRHAWLQKHPTPSAADGEFHWHPVDGDRELRASVVERARGVDAPAVIWELAPGRVSWAQAFATTAPRDRRRYTGLVLTVVERAGASPAELLDELALPVAAPWTEHPIVDEAARLAFTPADLAPLARALLSGEPGDSPHVVSPVEHGDGPHFGGTVLRAFAALEAMMPATIRERVRHGVWSAAESTMRREPDLVAMLVARATLAPGSRAGHGWRLLCELAAANDRTVDEVAAQLGTPDAVGERSDGDARFALPSTDFATTLHAWGRGRLDGTSSADALAARFADALILRVLASLIADRDPGAIIAAARWHALLPAGRRTLLFSTCLQRCPSLRLLTGGSHA